MSKRKHLAVRKPGGRIYSYGSQPSELLSPTEVRRLVDGAAMGLKDSTWSSTLGRLHLAGKLNASQLAAGKRWAELVSSYSQACRGLVRPGRSRLMLLVARRRIPTAKKAPGKFAVTSAPPRAIWMAATLFVSRAPQPNAWLRAFASMIRRRRASTR
jgi:hypothetical protein